MILACFGLGLTFIIVRRLAGGGFILVPQQFTNAATGPNSGDGFLVGVDSSGEATYNLQEAGVRHRWYIGGTEYLRLSISGLDVRSGSLYVAGIKVVGARDIGWTAMTGTADKATAYDTSTITLAQLAGRVMAIQAALTTHGNIGA